MKLRTKLKIVSSALFISGIIICLRHPLIYAIVASGRSQGIIAESILEYYSDYASYVDAFVYIVFALYMNRLDTKFPKAHFGKYFRVDIVATMLNVWILNQSYENLILGYLPKMSIEFITIITTFLCGYGVFRTLKNDAMRKVRKSYWLLSIRHALYFFVLCSQLICLSLIDGYTGDRLQSVVWIVIQWVLLMPLLFYSRFVLWRGTMELKIHSHHHSKEDDEPVQKVEVKERYQYPHLHHHHHHHHRTKWQKFKDWLGIENEHH